MVPESISSLSLQSSSIWHQYYPYRHFEDGISTPNVLKTIILIDEINEFDGPLCLVPGSRKAGLVTNEQKHSFGEDDSWFGKHQRSTRTCHH